MIVEIKETSPITNNLSSNSNNSSADSNLSN